MRTRLDQVSNTPSQRENFTLMDTTDTTEIEVKFFLEDSGPVRRKLLEIGCLAADRVFESNIRFEDGDSSLIRKKSLLRLRQDTVTTLTYKSRAGISNNQFKIHREFEVEVSDFTAMTLILEQLGFHKEQVYEKYRETFTQAKTTVCLDALPFGNFLEIEGDRENIRDMAARLGLQWDRRILKNYLSIFDRLRKKIPLPFFDITFDNFKTVQLDKELCRRLFKNLEAGRHP